ncbi:hypothetical protein ACHQM5_005898 [Ranunculus cassubicifolius]
MGPGVRRPRHTTRPPATTQPPTSSQPSSGVRLPLHVSQSPATTQPPTSSQLSPGVRLPLHVSQSPSTSQPPAASQPSPSGQCIVPSSQPSLGQTRGTKRKGGRKIAKNNALDAHFARGGPKPRIEILVGKARPLGPWSAQWVSEVGIICKQIIPVTCECWKDVTISQKTAIYTKLSNRFDVDFNVDRVVDAVDDSMKSLIRDRRNKFHKYYKNLCEGTNKREQPHKEVTAENWEELCTLFESEKFKAASARNKNNRKKQKVNHRGGCKSFVRHRHDLRDLETGKEPDQVDFYCIMRWNQKKGWIAPEAEANYDKMIDIRNQPVEEGNPKLTDAEIAAKVLGKRPGYIRGLGHGEVAPSRKKSAYNEYEMEQLRTTNIEQGREIIELRAWKAAQEEMSNNQQQMLEEQARKQKEQEELLASQARKQEEQQCFLDALKKKFGL